MKTFRLFLAVACVGAFQLRAAPVITSFSPTHGSAGDSVTIEGSGFGYNPDVISVKFFNNKGALGEHLGDNRLVVTVPPGTATGPITVTVAGESFTSLADFTVIGPGPYITGFSPGYGDANRTIEIYGVHFATATSVKFNGVAAEFNPNAAGTLISAYVPPTATTGPITVKNPFGTFTSPTPFTVVGAGPYIAGFDPWWGNNGTRVTLDGLHFTGASSVTFNGKPGANIFVQGDTRLQIDAPSGVTSGPLRVSTPQGSFTTSSNFYAPPVVKGFAPVFGRPGTNVIITGTNFLGALDVRFGGRSASGFTVLSNNAIRATVPDGVVSGVVRVNVPAGSFITDTNFRAQPTIISFGPAAVQAGTVVILAGAALDEGLSAVTFNGVSATFSNVTYSQVHAVVPAAARTGPITVTTTNGSFTTPGFAYLPPRIAGFTPTNSAPGTTVTLTGENFLGVSAVHFNGQPAVFTAPTNNTTLVATVPSHVTTGPINVTAPGGTVLTTNLFYGPVAITGFNPTHGVPGTLVTISGTNFLGVTQVQFNGVNATTFYAADNNTLVAAVPSSATSGQIRATTPAGSLLSAGTFFLDYTADMQGLISANPDPVTAGSNLVYTISLFNFGPHNATNVRMTNTLPAQVDLVGATTVRGTLATNSNPIIGDIGTVNFGEIITVKLTVRPKSAGTIVNTLRVGSDLADPTPANNSTNLSTVVLAPPAPRPTLQAVAAPPNSIAISWPVTATNYVLEAAASLSAGSWTAVTTPAVTNGAKKIVTEPRSSQTRFYRLHAQ